MNASRSERAFLQDILTAIADIEAALAGADFATFAAARPMQHAVLFNMQIIGEAANRLPPDLRARYPAVRWSQAIKMRHVIVHGYFAINLKIVWKTIIEDLPPLKAQVAAVLAEGENP